MSCVKKLRLELTLLFNLLDSETRQRKINHKLSPNFVSFLIFLRSFILNWIDQQKLLL